MRKSRDNKKVYMSAATWTLRKPTVISPHGPPRSSRSNISYPPSSRHFLPPIFLSVMLRISLHENGDVTPKGSRPDYALTPEQVPQSPSSPQRESVPPEHQTAHLVTPPATNLLPQGIRTWTISSPLPHQFVTDRINPSNVYWIEASSFTLSATNLFNSLPIKQFIFSVAGIEESPRSHPFDETRKAKIMSIIKTWGASRQETVGQLISQLSSLIKPLTCNQASCMPLCGWLGSIRRARILVQLKGFVPVPYTSRHSLGSQKEAPTSRPSR
ncbi:hypothetical protein VP01_119g12 [Puccinia sorghi]|uniref:Uncharacterized protein n=1 Tax=Puccinia sorghi TaxID=27349 RepID=A0A0L6VQN3_9BASI|nr:hypothetical protein VP01_119g12 [Puccinia sorghi]